MNRKFSKKGTGITKCEKSEPLNKLELQKFNVRGRIKNDLDSVK